jgi:hypothetical protein
MLHRLLGEDSDERLEKLTESERGPLLGSKIAELRPELDLYLVTDISVEEVAGKLGSHRRTECRLIGDGLGGKAWPPDPEALGCDSRTAQRRGQAAGGASHSSRCVHAHGEPIGNKDRA